MQQPEFSREVVATLISAVIGSAIDPEGVSPGKHPKPPQPPDEAAADAQALVRRLASILLHYDFRFAQFAESEMPHPLRMEYDDVRWMLLETMANQALLARARGPMH